MKAESEKRNSKQTDVIEQEIAESCEGKNTEKKASTDTVVNLTEEDKKLLKQSAIYKQYYKYTREKLYAGKIPVDDLKDLVEKNSETLIGCLFIAETYKYFKAEELGIKWLNGYKRKNPDMPEIDKKAIAGAMDILNNKRPMVTGVLQRQWNAVYRTLQSKAIIEDHSNHSDDEDGR